MPNITYRAVLKVLRWLRFHRPPQVSFTRYWLPSSDDDLDDDFDGGRMAWHRSSSATPITACLCVPCVAPICDRPVLQCTAHVVGVLPTSWISPPPPQAHPYLPNRLRGTAPDDCVTQVELLIDDITRFPLPAMQQQYDANFINTDPAELCELASAPSVWPRKA